jgi:hypothetical protein
MKSPRLRDRADVVELIEVGLPVENVRHYLEHQAPALAGRFEECVARARAKEE